MPSSFAIVSAFYPLRDEAGSTEILERFINLTSIFHVHLVCPPTLNLSVLPSNVTPHIMNFEMLETYKIMRHSTGLPRIRSREKDTLDFMILMNAKTEFIKIVRDAGVLVDNYIWLDAGISKIFKSPSTTFHRLATYLDSNNLSSDRIIIPGCFESPETRFDILLTRVCWRFCGGFFIVPCALVNRFALQTLVACEEIISRSGRAVWEVNTWAYAESRLPIQWVHGDHNERIFEGVYI